MAAVSLTPGLLVGSASGMLAETVSHGIWTTGLAVGALSTFATILGVIYGVRFRIAYEVERKAREGEQALNAALEDRIRTLAYEREEITAKLDAATEAVRKAEQTIARLEGLPNLERVIELMTVTFDRIRDRTDELHRENTENAELRVKRVIDEIRKLERSPE